MTREDARRFFWRDCRLTYNDVTLADLHRLKELIDQNFDAAGSGYWTSVRFARKYRGQYKDDGSMICAYMTGRGKQFYAREVISFNANGFIGFCGETDDINAQPVLTAFCEWCLELAKKKKGE